MTEQWLSIVEYARTFKVSDMTVRRRIKTGKLHAVLQEGKYFIPVQKDAPQAQPQPQPRPMPVSMPMSIPASAPAEMTIIKAHPQAYKTIVPVGSPLGSEDSTIPSSLRRPLTDHETSLVDTKALLAFCEASLRKLSEGERRIVERFKAKLEALEATLYAKDLEIKSLRQQVEDLQLLVRILEKKSPA